MVIQAGIFTSTIYVVKKTILDPYLYVRHHRQRLTSGRREEAAELTEEYTRKLNELRERVEEANAHAKEIHFAIITQAQKESEALLNQAEKNSQEILEKARHRIRQEMEQERAKIPAVVENLVETLYEKVFA
jgi:F0F1-type ATP synthase membrane subunit b/b'